MNKVILLGRLTKDNELKEAGKGKEKSKVVSNSIAVNMSKEQTEFVNVVFWNNIAENVNKFTKKGSRVMVEGFIKTDTYEVEGKNRSKTYVVASNVEFADTKKEETKKEDDTPIDDLPF